MKKQTKIERLHTEAREFLRGFQAMAHYPLPSECTLTEQLAGARNRGELAKATQDAILRFSEAVVLKKHEDEINEVFNDFTRKGELI